VTQTVTLLTYIQDIPGSIAGRPDRDFLSFLMSLHRNSGILRKLRHGNVTFEVLTAVVMRSTIFWDITPYSPLNVEEHIASIIRVEK
jgi:hypothetical protein